MVEKESSVLKIKTKKKKIFLFSREFTLTISAVLYQLLILVSSQTFGDLFFLFIYIAIKS